MGTKQPDGSLEKVDKLLCLLQLCMNESLLTSVFDPFQFQLTGFPIAFEALRALVFQSPPVVGSEASGAMSPPT